MLTYYPGYRSRKDLNNFYQDICEQPFRADGTTPGILQTLLKQGEFGVLGKVPIFESTFLQVTKRGEFINIHNHPNIITVGILASSPRLPLPNLLVIAQKKKDQEELEIKRMIPLAMVDIFVHNLSKRRLKIQMITGRKYYLQLCAPEEEASFLFERWIRLIYLLRTTRGTVRTSVTSTDPTLRMIWKSANIPRQTYPVSKKDHTLIPTKIKDSVELIRQHHSQESHSRKKQKKTQISRASKERHLKSGLTEYTSLGLSASEVHTSTDKHKVSFSKSPPVPVSKNATQPPTYGLGTQTGPSKARRSSLSKSSKFKQPSPQFIVQCNSSDISPEYSTLLANAEPSVPFTFSVTASLTKPDRQMSARKHTQMRDAGSRLFSEAERNTRTLESNPPIIKLQRSQKSRSLVQTPVLPPEIGHNHTEEKHATESQVKLPSSRGGRESSASQKFSRKQSQPEFMSPSTRTSAASTAPRYHSSASVDSFGQSGASWLTSAKPRASERSASTTPGSHPGKKPSRVSSRKKRTSDTKAISSEAVSKEEPTEIGDRPVSRELSQRSKPSKEYRTQTASVKPQKPRKATSHRSQTSSSPSPERGYSTSRSPDRKKSPGSQLRRTEESATLSLSHWKTGAVRPSEMVSMDQTGQQSQALRPDKQKELEMRSSREKSGKQYQPSHSKWQQESSRAQVNEPKKKLKSALSSAKQRSSLTFVTIYSALSSSLDKIKGSKSKEDTKLHPQEKTPQVFSKPFKRVTISGVIGPSGKDFVQQEAENLTTAGTEGMNEDSGVAATLGTDSSEVSSPSQFHEPKFSGTSEANITGVHADSSIRGHISSAAEPSSPDKQITLKEPSVARSVIPQKPSRGGTGQSSAQGRKSQSRAKKTPRSKLPSSKHSEKSPSTRVASKKRKVTTLPPRSKKITTTGVSVDAVDAGGGNRVWEQEEPGVHPQKKRRRDELWRPSFHPSSGPTKPTSSVSRKANKRSKVREMKNALAASFQQQSQISPGEKTSSGPAGHLSEEKIHKSKTSKKSHVQQDEGHHRIETESVVMEGLQMNKAIKGAGQPKSSSKTGPKLQDSRLFRPGGWLEYVERGDKKSTDNRPSSPKSKKAAPSKSHVAIHSSGDTVVRSAL